MKSWSLVKVHYPSVINWIKKCYLCWDFAKSAALIGYDDEVVTVTVYINLHFVFKYIIIVVKFTSLVSVEMFCSLEHVFKYHRCKLFVDYWAFKANWNVIIKTLFQEASHLTTHQSSVRASNKWKQLTNKLTNACTWIHINWTD